MKLQLAVDTSTIKEGLEILEQTAEYLDIIEVGTPLMLAEGCHAVREFRKHYPDKIILADCKIRDGAAVIAGNALDAGADIVTALADSHDKTITELVRVCHEYGKQAEVDLMNMYDAVEKRAPELLDLGVDIINLHGHSDSHRPGEHHYNAIRRLMDVVPREKTAIIDYLDFDCADQILSYRPGIIVTYKPIFFAEDKREAAKKLRELVDKYNQK